MNLLSLLCLLVLSVGSFAQEVVPSSPVAGAIVVQRAPVPDAEVQKGILATIQNVLASEYSARGREGELMLLDALIGLAEEVREEVNERYVVLTEARRVALELDETLDALDLSRQLDAEYELPDGWKLIVISYVETAANAEAEDRDSVISTGLAFVEECLNKAEIESAEQVLSKVRILVKRGAAKSPLRAYWEESNKRVKGLSKVKAAVARLQEDPQDPKACEELGRFFALELGNFERGLPLLARGEDEKLKEVAERELAGATEAGEQVALGRLWLEVANKAKGSQRLRPFQKAQVWIQLGIGGLGTLDRIGAQNDLDAIAAELHSLTAGGDALVGRKPLPAGTRRVLATARGKAMTWLASHQDEDGKWDCDEFMKHDPEVQQCEGAGQPQRDVGVTGLSLLVFLRAGHSPQFGRYKDVVDRGVNWLLTQQDPESGLIGDKEQDDEFLYGHAIATLALCESLRLNPNEPTRAAAQKAVDFIMSARNSHSAWRYQQPGNGENDTSVTGWMVCALKAAEAVNLNIDTDAFAGAKSWIDEVTETTSGRVGYNETGSFSSRVTGVNDNYPPENGETMTAVGLLCRFLIGQVPAQDPIMEKHAELIEKKLPAWSEDGFFADMYYWYFGTEAMSRMGGAYWSKWSAEAKEELLGAQCDKLAASGSWDPIGPWGFAGGRIYSTAMAALTLGCIEDSGTSNSGRSKRSSTQAKSPESNVKQELEWAEVLDRKPDSKVVTDKDFRKAIESSGLPWRVHHKASGVELLLVPIDIEASEFLYVGRYEVQESEWAHVFEGTALGKSLGLPKIAVPYSKVLEYFELVGDDGLRLPTEDEWEIACRAGTEGLTYGDLNEVAWNKNNSGGKPHEVGTRKANAFGLSDMLGNANEWCPNGFLRGGSYRFGAEKITAEWSVKASSSIPAVGFRLVHEAR